MIIRYGSDDPYRVGHTADWVPIAGRASASCSTTAAVAAGETRSTVIPQAVLDDVLDEYVSVAGARRDYGVVLTGSLEDLTLALDETATTRLRAEIAPAPDGRRLLMGGEPEWATASVSTSAARSPTSSV